jgi:hypothetical protein
LPGTDGLTISDLQPVKSLPPLSGQLALLELEAGCSGAGQLIQLGRKVLAFPA